MKIVNDETITDIEGKKRIITFENGVKAEHLLEPSQKWLNEHPALPNPVVRDNLKELDELKQKLKDAGIIV